MWHPNDEAEACSELAALLEWLRATRGMDDLTPDSLRYWSRTDPVAFNDAVTPFLRLDDASAATRSHRVAALLRAWDQLKQPTPEPEPG